MKIIMERNRKTDNKFFLDGQKGVLLDFSKKEDVRLFAVHYLCENVTALKEKNNAYYIDDSKYLDKDEMLKYLDEMFNELKDGVIKGKTYLCSDYCGKYSDIVETYKKILHEIRLNNYKIVGIPIEQYIDGGPDREKDYVIKIMIPIKIDLYCYATENDKMNLNDEETLKEYKEKYRKWLSLLWDDKEITEPKVQGPSYVDPDMLNEEKRINPSFYADLCAFLNHQSNNKEYTYTPDDKFINGNFVNEQEKFVVNFVSDQFGFSAPSKKMNHPYGVYLKKCKSEGKNKEESINKVINWVMEARTIGGSFIWPLDIWKSYNRERGGSISSKDTTRFYIEDRVDLTLCELKHYLDNMDRSKDKLKVKENSKGQKWLKSFKSFDEYVKFFYFMPFVSEEGIPYDIVRSNFANSDKRVIENIDKKSSIYNLNADQLEIMFNNINLMIKERSLMITIDKLNANE